MSTIVETFREFSKEELQQVETMAGLFFKPDDIAIACGWDAELSEEFINILELSIRTHILYQRYHTGRITAEIQLRQQIKQAAANGSNPAQNTMLDFKENSIL
jgi:hypothetical protein